MEKVRFEAFNVEELRVLRRACYEAAAAQQKQEEPVGKAAEDSEKGTAERLPFALKAFQKPEPQKKRMVQRPDILERAKAAQPAESAHRGRK